MTELILFASAFVTVFALGFQSLNVNNGHYASAFLTSFIIGLGHIALYRVLPQASWTEFAAYLFGGPFGITASMIVHKKTLGRKKSC